MRNTNDTPRLLLLRVSSQPANLWRSLQGNVFTLPFTVIASDKPANFPLRTEDSSKCQAR